MISYEEPEMRYRVGQEVLLGVEAGRIADLSNSAQRGVIIARHLAPVGTEYAVRFPGRLGMIRLPAKALLPAPPFRPIFLARYGAVRSLEMAEQALIATAARISDRDHLGLPPDRRDIQDRDTLAAALEQRCHLRPGQLLAQLQPQIAAAARYSAGTGAGADELEESNPIADVDVMLIAMNRAYASRETHFVHAADGGPVAASSPPQHGSYLSVTPEGRWSLHADDGSAVPVDEITGLRALNGHPAPGAHPARIAHQDHPAQQPGPPPPPRKPGSAPLHNAPGRSRRSQRSPGVSP